MTGIDTLHTIPLGVTTDVLNELEARYPEQMKKHFGKSYQRKELGKQPGGRFRYNPSLTSDEFRIHLNVKLVLNVIHFHKIWSWILGGQGLILRRTPVSIVSTALVCHLSLQNVIFPVKMIPFHKVWMDQEWTLSGATVISIDHSHFLVVPRSKSSLTKQI